MKRRSLCKAAAHMEVLALRFLGTVSPTGDVQPWLGTLSASQQALITSKLWISVRLPPLHSPPPPPSEGVVWVGALGACRCFLSLCHILAVETGAIPAWTAQQKVLRQPRGDCIIFAPLLSLRFPLPFDLSSSPPPRSVSLRRLRLSRPLDPQLTASQPKRRESEGLGSCSLKGVRWCHLHHDVPLLSITVFFKKQTLTQVQLTVWV